MEGAIGVNLREEFCDIFISLCEVVVGVVRGIYIGLEIGESESLLLLTAYLSHQDTGSFFRLHQDFSSTSVGEVYLVKESSGILY